MIAVSACASSFGAIKKRSISIAARWQFKDDRSEERESRFHAIRRSRELHQSLIFPRFGFLIAQNRATKEQTKSSATSFVSGPERKSICVLFLPFVRHLEPLLLLFVRSALSKSLVYGSSRRNASFNKEKLGNNINTSLQEEGKNICKVQRHNHQYYCVWSSHARALFNEGSTFARTCVMLIIFLFNDLASSISSSSLLLSKAQPITVASCFLHLPHLNELPNNILWNPENGTVEIPFKPCLKCKPELNVGKWSFYDYFYCRLLSAERIKNPWDWLKN